MQSSYIIIIALILTAIGVAHFQYREKVGLAPHEVRVCTLNDDCHHVDETLVQAVLDKAYAIAQSDDAETFPIETVDDLDSVYVIDADSLEKIGTEVVNAFHINPERVSGNHYFDDKKTVNELILFLHLQQNQSS